MTWDPMGVAGDGPQPDPFCQFEPPSGTVTASSFGVTRTVTDSFTATWNQTVMPGTSTITAAEIMSANVDTWRVWVGDSEMNGRGNVACQLHPLLLASTLANGTMSLNNTDNCVSVSLIFVCQP